MGHSGSVRTTVFQQRHAVHYPIDNNDGVHPVLYAGVPSLLLPAPACFMTWPYLHADSVSDFDVNSTALLFFVICTGSVREVLVVKHR